MFAREGSGFDAVESDESIHFGCSMLSRIRLQPRNGAKLATIRCHLGYALHSDEEVAKCMAVDGPGECWKVVPTWRVPEAAPAQVATVVTRDEIAEPEAGPTSSSIPGEVIPIDTMVEGTGEARIVQFRPPPRPTGTDHSETD
jgi:hypothetical protein